MIKSSLKLLLISDNPEYTESISNIYPRNNNTPITLETVKTLSEGLEHIRNGAIEAVLLRLSQPELSKSLNYLRKTAITIPVIALIRQDERGAGIRAIREGAHNYLPENTTDIISLVRCIRYASEGCKIAEELRSAGQKVMEYKKYKDEIEGLKAIIEEYGAAFHEINQPLTALLGSIYLMGLDKDNREKISRHMERIEESGKRISGIVKKIQSLRSKKENFYLGSASFMDPDPKVKSHSEVAEDSFENMNNLFRIVQARYNRPTALIK